MLSPFHCSKLSRIKKIIAAAAYSVTVVVLPKKGSSNHYAASAISSLSNCLKEKPRGESKSPPCDNNQSRSSSYTVSYLVNSCGLSPERAESVSKKVKFESLERPNSVLKLLKNQGFNDSHISAIIRTQPDILLLNPQKTLLPKLEFLHSIGLSNVDLARDPALLSRSLENRIIPSYKFLKGVLGSNKKVTAVMKRAPWVISTTQVASNLKILREFAVPESKIVLLLAHFPKATIQKHDRFVEIVSKVMSMGFNPLKSTFVLAIHALSGKCNRSIRERCYEAYKKWDWSENDISEAFKRFPQCMLLSEKKIEGVMGFFVNQMGYQSNEIAKMPTVLCYSLEKRIIPRLSVIQVLTSKGLIKKFSLCSVLQPGETYFLDRFVAKYEDQLPQLMSVYQRKINIFGTVTWTDVKR